VKEWDDDIIFMHKIVPGAADRSYGIQVAKLAGLPSAVTQRASEVLALLEDSDRKDGPGQVLEDLPLFAATRPKSYMQDGMNAQPSEVEEAVGSLNPDEFSPRAALEELYRLKDLSRKTRSDS
jgi:DNA mismatch repair protein MutS